MYSIVLEDDLIYDDRIQDKKYSLINPVLEMEDSAGGSLTFTVPPTNVCYSYLDDEMLRCMVRVYKGGTYTTNSIWQGRIISIESDMWNQKKIECEGALSFFADCTNNADTLVTHGADTQGRSPSVYSAFLLLQNAIDGYNTYNSGGTTVDKVWTNYKIQIGTVTMEVPNQYDGNGLPYPTPQTTSQTCLQNLQNLVKTYGGHMRVRESSNGELYLDWLKGYPRRSGQVIDFGKNLLDFTVEKEMGSIYTVLHPLGDEIDKDDNYTDEHPTFYEKWWINNAGEWSRCENDPEYFTSATMNVDTQKSYYYSGRMKGNWAIYSILDANDIVMYVGKSGAKTSSEIKSFTRQKIDFPEGAKKIRVGWFRDDNYKYKDDQGNEHVHPVTDYSKLESLPPNSDAIQARVNISSVNNNSEYLKITSLFEKYGWIEKKVIFENINQPNGLKKAAERYIANATSLDNMVLEVKAIDLSLMDVNVEDIRLLDTVIVRSVPHGLNGIEMPVTKIKIPMDKPEQQTFTLGIAVRKSISQIVGGR